MNELWEDFTLVNKPLWLSALSLLPFSSISSAATGDETFLLCAGKRALNGKTIKGTYKYLVIESSQKIYLWDERDQQYKDQCETMEKDGGQFTIRKSAVCTVDQVSIKFSWSSRIIRNGSTNDISEVLSSVNIDRRTGKFDEQGRLDGANMAPSTGTCKVGRDERLFKIF